MDLSCFAWCIGDPSQNNEDLQLFQVRQSGGEGAAPDTGACEDRISVDCANWEGNGRRGGPLQTDRYDDTALASDHYLDLNAFDVSIQIRDLDISKGTRNCIYVEGEDRSPKRGDADCRNVEPGSDYTDTVSVLTITLITVLTLAAITFTWVMHRSYRISRLRKYSTPRPAGEPAHPTDPSIRRSRQKLPPSSPVLAHAGSPRGPSGCSG
jgi:hypothetical protein